MREEEKTDRKSLKSRRKAVSDDSAGPGANQGYAFASPDCAPMTLDIIIATSKNTDTLPPMSGALSRRTPQRLHSVYPGPGAARTGGSRSATG